MENQNRSEQMGACWVREKNGMKYMTGTVTCPDCHLAHAIAIFKNKYKTADNQPDWRILKSGTKPALNENGAEKVAPTKTAEEEYNDLPF